MNEDTNLKAIHNGLVKLYADCKLFFNERRYKFESNSQHADTSCNNKLGCFSMNEDTNLKAIHKYNHIFI